MDVEKLKADLSNFKQFSKFPYNIYDEEIESDLKGIIEKYNLAQYVDKKQGVSAKSIAEDIDEPSLHLHHFMELAFEKIFEANSDEFDKPPIKIVKYAKNIALLLDHRQDVLKAFLKEYESLDTISGISENYLVDNYVMKQKKDKRKKYATVRVQKETPDLPKPPPKPLKIEEAQEAPGFIFSDYAARGTQRKGYEPMSIRRQMRQQIGANDPFDQLLNYYNQSSTL